MADQDDALKAAYQEVGSSARAIEVFRAKLLGLLPLASGTGIFLLVNSSSNTRNPLLLVPVGLFGCAITVGLAVLESRLQRRNGSLVQTGKFIESSLNIIGPFRLRAPTNTLGNRLAASIIYSAVFSAWMFLVAFSLFPESWYPIRIVSLIFLVLTCLAELFQSFLMRNDSGRLDKRIAHCKLDQ